MTTNTSVTTQVYRVWIKATPQAIWDAITQPEWTARYGFGGRGVYELRPGGSYQAFASDAMKKAAADMGFPIPDVVVDGQIREVDPPNRLVQSWRMLMDPTTAEEGFTTLTYEIEEGAGGVTKLSLIHELEGAPTLAALVSGAREREGAGAGWGWVLSDLKTLLESGSPMDAHDPMRD